MLAPGSGLVNTIYTAPAYLVRKSSWCAAQHQAILLASADAEVRFLAKPWLQCAYSNSRTGSILFVYTMPRCSLKYVLRSEVIGVQFVPAFSVDVWGGRCREVRNFWTATVWGFRTGVPDASYRFPSSSGLKLALFVHPCKGPDQSEGA